MFTINELHKIVSQEIESLDYTNKPQELYEPYKYILGLGGKRIRPILVLASCNLFCKDISFAKEPAIGFEIFHNFTLLHDDVMDNSPIRRGKPTVHEKWDVNRAILSGDLMLIKAYDLLLKTPSNNLNHMLQLFNKTAREVCEGQQFDMNFETQNNVSVKDYLNMIKLKTSVLIAACLKAGAILGGATKTDADLLYEFGLNMGLAFQLQDDLLDVYGDTKTFGKQTGGDIIEGKKTFLLINAFQKSDIETRKRLEQIIKNKNTENKTKVKQVIDIYDKRGIKQLTENEIKKYNKIAIEALKNVSVPEENKQVLYDFSNSLTVRKK